MLTNDELTARLDRLAGSERDATAELIAHLAEFDERGLHLDAGFSSLFSYCTQVLRLSEHASYHRIDAARASRRYPLLLARLREGSINLTTISLLSSHLTADNSAALIDAASGKSKREVEELVARCFPQPAVPASLRKLPSLSALPPVTSRVPEDPAAPDCSAEASPAQTNPTQTNPTQTNPTQPNWTGEPATALRAVAALTSASRAAVVPLAPDRYKITFTATAQTRDTLQRARELLRHQIPDGDLGQIFERALSAFVQQLEKKKSALCQRPRQGAPARAASRHIPADVRRAVWVRDAGSCAFRAGNGRRCGERSYVEFHHSQPFAAGGAASVTNIALRCRAHNGYESQLYYGPTRAGPH